MYTTTKYFLAKKIYIYWLLPDLFGVVSQSYWEAVSQVLSKTLSKTNSQLSCCACSSKLTSLNSTLPWQYLGCNYYQIFPLWYLIFQHYLYGSKFLIISYTQHAIIGISLRPVSYYAIIYNNSFLTPTFYLSRLHLLIFNFPLPLPSSLPLFFLSFIISSC